MSFYRFFSWFTFWGILPGIVLLALLVPSVSTPAHAQPLPPHNVDFQQGLESFSNQWYAQAFELWSKAKPNQWSGDWCGYTAQAAWKSGKPAEAICWAYRGLRVEPNHTALRQELHFMLSSQQLISEMPPEPPNLFWQISIDALGRRAVLLLWLAWLVLIGHHLLPQRIKFRRIFPFAFGLLLFLSLSLFGLAWGRYFWTHGKEAVAAVSSTALKAAPEHNAQEIQRLKAGQRVRLVDKQQEWHKVRLTNEVSGWVRTEELLPILPEADL